MTNVITTIPHSRVHLEQDDVDAVAEVLRTGHIAQGLMVQSLERELAQFVGVRGGVAVSSGTVALELAMRAVGVGPGDEVIMPSFVCAAPWLAAKRIGAIPILVDIKLDAYALDPAHVEQALSTRTKTIIVPHLFGFPAHLTALENFDVPIIEDCAQTLGAMENGRQVGTVGTMAVCSLYATKLLCAGEGGMILSNHQNLLSRALGIRQYDEMEHLNAAAGNYKMTDMQAALGLAQLAKLKGFLNRRSEIAGYYRSRLQGKSIELPSIVPGRTHVYFRFVVRLPYLKGKDDVLAHLMARLENRGIQCRRPIFRPLHRYLGETDFPKSDEAYHTALSLPIYPSLTDEEVEYTATVLCEEIA